MPAGRPSKCTPELLDDICDQVMLGRGIKQICEQPGYPDRTTVNRWLLNDPEFSSRVMRARAVGAHTAFEETYEIADSATVDDWKVAQLRVQTRQWAIPRVAPKDYGDKLQVSQNTTISIQLPPALAASFAAGVLEDGKTIEGEL